MKHVYLIFTAIIVSKLAIGQCSVTVSPVSRTLTCNGAPATFTANVTAPSGYIFMVRNPGGSTSPVKTSTVSPYVFSLNAPGIYTLHASTGITCYATQTISVISPTSVPSVTINVSAYDTLCLAGPAYFGITTSPGPAPKNETWTNLSTSVSITNPPFGYSVTTPGNYQLTYVDGNNCSVTFTTIIVGVACPTGISEMDDNIRISIRPNPNQGYFLIETDQDINAELIILNNMGQEVHKQVVVKGKNNIDVRPFPGGMYYYTIKDRNRYLKQGKVLLD